MATRLTPRSPPSRANELLVSLELLAAEGLLSAAEIRDPGFMADRIDYGAVIAWKRPLLDRAAAAFARAARPFRKAALDAFLAREAFWLDDYALFRAIKDGYDAKAGEEGRDGAIVEQLLARRTEAPRARSPRKRSVRSVPRPFMVYKILQFFFAEQWKATKTVAKQSGVSIIGDLPIFVAADSADLWSHPELFMLDAERRLVEIAGVPPDYFAADGQLWGNPLYDWDACRKDGYAWWIARIESRVAPARHPQDRPLPRLRGVFRDSRGSPRRAGRRLARRSRPRTFRRALRLPLHFRFRRRRRACRSSRRISDSSRAACENSATDSDSRECGYSSSPSTRARAASPSIRPTASCPHNYPEHTVVYTGTHDNNTVRGWWEGASAEERAYTMRYMGSSMDEGGTDGRALRTMPSTHPVSEAFIREGDEIRRVMGGFSDAGHPRPGIGGENQHAVHARRQLDLEDGSRRFRPRARRGNCGR